MKNNSGRAELMRLVQPVKTLIIFNCGKEYYEFSPSRDLTCRLLKFARISIFSNLIREQEVLSSGINLKPEVKFYANSD